MSGTLYAFPNDFRAHKILIAAQYGGNAVKVDPNFVPGETDKSEGFLKKFPFGKVPAFESGDLKLFQTNGIAHFVGNEQTRGGDNEAEVLQWIGFADSVIEPAACTWVYPTLGILQYNKQNTEKAKSDIKSALTALNEYLSTRTFLVGERVTQADISVACTLCMLYVHVMDPEFRKPFGNVTRWFVTLINQPQFKAVLCDVKLCEKMAQFDAKKYNEIHGKAQKAPKQKGAGDSKSPKPKKETPKKKEKDEEEDAPAPKEKKDPWGHLPATSYDMDAWKRQYSNDKEKFKPKSLAYFWEHFDKEKYSIWRGTYKHNEEFEVEFMVRNLAKGMCQRLEKMRKHSFGIYGILQKGEKTYMLDSIWFWRGHDLAFELCDDWKIDYEEYDWKKMDPDADETKNMWKEYFSFGAKDKLEDGWEIADWWVYK